MSIRRITFGGNLTADPEVRQAGGNTVCNFSLPAMTTRAARRSRILLIVMRGERSGSLLPITSKRAAGSSSPGLLAGSAIPPRRAKNERLSGCV